MLDDWIAHGKFTRAYPYPVVVVARGHAPPRHKEGRPLVHALDLYELAVCRSPGSAEAVTVGMKQPGGRADRGRSGSVDERPRSWVYRHPRVGARIYFTDAGYVDGIQWSLTLDVVPA